MNEPTASPGRSSPVALVVAAAPVLGVEPGHVAEARRALRAQGKDLDAEGVVRLLWAARALPTALDVLADARSPEPLASAVLDGVEVEAAHAEAARGPGPGAGPRIGSADELVAVARLEAGPPPEVLVLIVERRALLSAGSDVVTPRCTVRFRLAPRAGGDDMDNAEETVQLRRFTLSRPA